MSAKLGSRGSWRKVREVFFSSKIQVKVGEYKRKVRGIFGVWEQLIFRKSIEISDFKRISTTEKVKECCWRVRENWKKVMEKAENFVFRIWQGCPFIHYTYCFLFTLFNLFLESLNPILTRGGKIAPHYEFFCISKMQQPMVPISFVL